MTPEPAAPAVGHAEWTADRIRPLLELPFHDLVHRAHVVFREHWDPNLIQASTLLSVKTGGCAEDCGYCSQSAHHDTGLEVTPLMSREEVRRAAQRAQDAGATRFCMSAAWRRPRDQDLERAAQLVEEVKSLGLETCMTLGMLTDPQAQRLHEAGLDYYNHNIDTSPEYYENIITTRTFDDRLRTLDTVRRAGMKVCSGGIVGLGESREDRAAMLATLAGLDPPPESVPINILVPIAGTPLQDRPPVDTLEVVRTVAAARITMPRSYVRLSAGRKQLSEEAQALCFHAGANSVFRGEHLLTTDNREPDEDDALFAKLGLRREE